MILILSAQNLNWGGGGGGNKKTTMALLISKKPEFNILIFDFFPLFFGCRTQRHLGN